MLLKWVEEFLSSTAGVLMSAATIFGVCAGIYKWAKRQKETLDKIYDQVHNNGGTSLKDAIDRVEAFAYASLRMTEKAYWFNNKDGECLIASPGLAKLFGGTPEQIEGWGAFTFIAPEDRDTVRKEWLSAVQERREFDYEFSILRPTGERIRAKGHGIPVVTQGTHELIGFLGWTEAINT